MKYVEMVLSIEDAAIIRFPRIVEKMKDWSKRGIKFIRLVTDGVRPDYILHFSGSSIDPLKANTPSFNELYDRIKEPTTQKLTILKALYNHVSPEIITTIINTPIASNNKYIQGLLAESNGYLIYKHQLEQFIMDKLNYSQAAAMELRRDWNKKSIRQREILIQSDDYYLIENKMPQYFVFEKPETSI